MPRIIAGSAGGRRLAAPRGASTRPTADRVKEALFSSLGPMTGLVVLDLFAGSGGLGIEALSRGAIGASFIEHDRRAINVIRENLTVAGATASADVHEIDAARFCTSPETFARAVAPPYDLVLLDPPYAMSHDEIVGLLTALVTARAVNTSARLVIERDRDAQDGSIPGFAHVKDKRYGETTLRYHQLG